MRSFPLSVSCTGGMRVEITAPGADREMFGRAYLRIEMEFLGHEDKCGRRASHAALDADRYQYIVLNELMFWTMFALNDPADDPLWGPLAKDTMFGPSPNGVCMICGPLPAPSRGQNQVLLPRYLGE